MKTCLLTLATPEIHEHCPEFAENKLAYATRHKYDIVCGFGPSRPGVPPSYDKIPLINKYLEMDYDFVIWADMDVAFMNFGIEVTSLLPENSWIGGCQEFTHPVGDSWPPIHGFKPYICGCLLVIRVNQSSRDFFKRLGEIIGDNPTGGTPWEQKDINDLLEQRGWEGLKAWNPDEIGGGWVGASKNLGIIGWTLFSNGAIRGWKTGELMLHLGGAGDYGDIPWFERRIEFREVYMPQVIK